VPDALAIARQTRDLALQQTGLDEDARDEILDRYLEERDRSVQMAVDAIGVNSVAVRVRRVKGVQ
jgi:hypothetical protein